MDCSSITDFQQSTAIRIAKKFRNLHIGKWPKRKWFGRADRLQFPQILPFSPEGWPDTDPSYSG